MRHLLFARSLIFHRQSATFRPRKPTLSARCRLRQGQWSAHPTLETPRIAHVRRGRRCAALPGAVARVYDLTGKVQRLDGNGAVRHVTSAPSVYIQAGDR